MKKVTHAKFLDKSVDCWLHVKSHNTGWISQVRLAYHTCFPFGTPDLLLRKIKNATL
jgi:hypothetical protein